MRETCKMALVWKRLRRNRQMFQEVNQARQCRRKEGIVADEVEEIVV
jgi:hypothetical protein